MRLHLKEDPRKREIPYDVRRRRAKHLFMRLHLEDPRKLIFYSLSSLMNMNRKLTNSRQQENQIVLMSNIRMK